MAETLKDWLEENFPRNPNPSLLFVDKKTKAKLLKQRVKEHTAKIKTVTTWRDSLIARTNITEEDITRCVNTVMELMEEELMNGGTVRITNFGDLTTMNLNDERRIRFRCDEQFVRSINKPIFADEIGLYYRMDPKDMIRRKPNRPKKQKKITPRT